MFGMVFKLIRDKWTAYNQTIDLQRQLIKTLLADRHLQSGSYVQSVDIQEDGKLTNTVHFFFSDDRIQKIFLKEGVEEITNSLIENYEPKDSCKCDCHRPLMTNIIPFPYLYEGEYYDD